MVTGSDVRRFRRQIGWNQKRFAERMSLSQSALSLLESGKIGVSDEHLARLRAKFSGDEVSTTFEQFLAEVNASAAAQRAALHSPGARHVLLTVWGCEGGLDLARPLPPSQAVGLVAVRDSARPAIALSMPRASAHWAAGEILVFEECSTDHVRNGAVCLVQVAQPRGRGTRTVIAVAHVGPTKREQSLHFEPISPAGPVFAVEPAAIIALLRVTFRARYEA